MGVSMCHICYREYAKLSQHLKVYHHVLNLEERKLILALTSGRIQYRVGRCPVLGCDKETTRLDRHLERHTELSKKARWEAVDECKKTVIMARLAALRASNPKPPMATTLDLKEDEVMANELVVVENMCCLESCQREKLRLKSKIADLNQQIDTLSAALCEITRRYRVLKRQCVKKASKTIASPVPLKPQCSTQQSLDQPEPSTSPHLVILNEHNGGPDPKVTQEKIIDEKMFRLNNCLVNMTEGNLNLPTVQQTSQGLVMLRPLNQLKLRTSCCPFFQKRTTRRSQARKHFVSKSYTLTGLARAKKAKVKIEKAINKRQALLIK